MATTYPGTIDSFTNPSGTQTLDSPDHALQHSNANDAIEAIEATLGTTSGTAILKNITTGNFAARQNSETFGSATINVGTINNALLGTPDIRRGTAGTPTLVLGSDATGDLFYRSSGGTVTRLGIGTSGQFLTTNGTTPSWGGATTTSPSFSVHKNGTAQVGGFGASDAFVKTTWSTELFDSNSNFATSTFTPTVAGKYLLTACLSTNSNVVDQTNMYAAIYKNGALVNLNTTRTSGSVGNSVTITAIVDANGSTDTFDVYGAKAASTAYDIDGDATKTFFMGSKIG